MVVRIKKGIGLKFFLLFAIFVSPMGAQALSFGFGSRQMSLMRLTIALSLGLYLLYGIRTNRLRLYNKRNAYSAIFTTLWFAYAFLSILWSIDNSAWFRSVFFIFIGMAAMFLFISSFTTVQDILHAFLALEFGAALQALIGWYEVITRDYHYLNMNEGNVRVYVRGYLRIPIAMQGNPNDFATLMFVSFFVALICSAVSEKKTWKWFHLFIAVNYAVLLVLTTSRANILGMFLALAVLILLLGKKKGFIALTAVFTIFLIPQVVSYFSDQLYFTFGNDGSDSGRLNLIRTGIDYLLESFGFGVGAGQFEAWIMTKGSKYYLGKTTNIHNWWAEILCDYGVAVFIGYLVFYARLFFDNLRIARGQKKQSETKTISTMLDALLVGFIIASISSSSNISCEWLWMFWAICIAYQGLLGTGTDAMRNFVD